MAILHPYVPALVDVMLERGLCLRVGAEPFPSVALSDSTPLEAAAERVRASGHPTLRLCVYDGEYTNSRYIGAIYVDPCGTSPPATAGGAIPGPIHGWSDSLDYMMDALLPLARERALRSIVIGSF